MKASSGVEREPRQKHPSSCHSAAMLSAQGYVGGHTLSGKLQLAHPIPQTFSFYEPRRSHLPSTTGAGEEFCSWEEGLLPFHPPPGNLKTLEDKRSSPGHEIQMWSGALCLHLGKKPRANLRRAHVIGSLLCFRQSLHHLFKGCIYI